MTPTLSQLADVLGKFSDLSPQLQAERCLNQRHRRAGGCAACQEACPCGAITLRGAPQIEQGACLGCDACAAACPVGALEGRRHPLTVWREACQDARDGVATLACRALGAGRFAATRIPCVGALAPEFYVALAAAGVRQVVLHTAGCESCPLAEGLPQAEQAIDTASAFLERLGLALTVTHKVGAPAAAAVARTAVSRRNFLTAAFRDRTQQAASTDRLDAYMAAGVGWRRALLLEALARLPVPAGAALPTQERLWGALTVGEACVGCQMCARFCPTEALAATADSDGQVTLWLDAARCTACGLCERVCFKQAIRLSDEVSLSALAHSRYVPLWQGHPPQNALKSKVKQASR